MISNKSIAIIKVYLSIVLILAILFLLLSPGVAFAESSSGSNVLNDLSIDESFNTEDYPIDEEDNSLQIITIAESTNKELLLYVYQPATSRDFRANYISMSTAINDSIDPNIYSLTFCNREGTLYKYKVDDFVVVDDDVRYYEIYSIFRPFVERIDEEAVLDNEVNAVAFEVARQWKLGEINGNNYIECREIESITITDKFIGFVRYLTGGTLKYDYYTDSHFVAFNTDRSIDKLLEADVYYVSQGFYKSDSYGNETIEFYDSSENKVLLKADNYDSANGKGWFFKESYSWEQIQTSAQFLSELDDDKELYSGAVLDVSLACKITDEVRNELTAKKWVLRFADTDYERETTIYVAGSQPFYEWRGTSVSEVTILRLKFIYNGKTYNLGAIDNMQTGQLVNTNEVIVKLSESVQEILDIICLVLMVVAVIAVVVFVKPVGEVIKFIAKAIIWILTLPFRALRKIFAHKKADKSYRLQYAKSKPRKNNNKRKYKRG